MHPHFKDRVEVSQETGCWIWKPCMDKQGYGRASYQGRWNIASHRLSYELHVGPIPEGLTVDHLCFNTICANPDHLQLLTNSMNARRQRSAFKTHCLHGHPFDESNTYMRLHNGRRQCRTCNADAARRYKQRKIDQAKAATK